MRITHTTLVGLAILAASTACSHKRPPATAPTPAASAEADRAQREASDKADAERRAAESRAAEQRTAEARAAIQSSLTTPIRFEFDHAEITDEGMRLLDAKIEALQGNPSIHIRVEGNADDSGSDEYNMVLSQRRAAVVNRYMTERGIDQSRIQIVSFGEEKPICTSREESCRAQNRRDEFVVTAGLERVSSR